MKKRVAFIGCGNMGGALLKGILSQKVFTSRDITIYDKRGKRLQALQGSYGIGISSSNENAVEKADIVILALKPQDMETVLSQAGYAMRDKLVISIAAGKTIDFIRNKTQARKITRAMPNTPALVGHGITALAYSRGMARPDKKITEAIFNCVGRVVILDEKYMDAVTAVSGSGPAYLFLFMEAMAKAAVSLGLNKAISYRLITQTVYGSSCLQQALNRYPALLREDVTSKGGTTEAALEVFRKKGFDNIIEEAVTAAFKRSRQLLGDIS
jgi:pyrroline-5-carboxylate reductase